MVVIDAHCHLSQRWTPVGPATLLIDDMDATGVEMAVVFGVFGDAEDNAFVAKSAREHPNRFIPLVNFDPRYEEVGLELVEKYLGEHKWKGVKVGHTHTVARYMYPMMEIAESYNSLVAIHSDHSIRNHPYIIGDIANSFPNVPTVILHMGGGTCFDSELLSTKIAEKNDNIYLETCYSNPYAIKQAVETIGPEKIIFGSDSSNGGYGSRFEKAGDYMELMLDAVRVADITPEQKAMVLGDSAANLLGI
ncbi:MAG: amidohydrolase family protein [Candidatus Bathyarchaeota archaeon]|nr:amidohydrolase family protein [Candidatus Bathyarchaeota archaeon]MDP7207974.1 amidohydrolase family protein [Candidatus Bathyarchaeota archaeon]MDP7443337.1 amidohydrolase family protein [Candidatus Bathyarchaeota archaeon]|tara:strand:- start:231 stop:977 length:747 start_codon:yes stop_codon:yes gene_type:complete